MNRFIQNLILGTALSFGGVAVAMPAFASPPAAAKAPMHVHGTIVSVSTKDRTITVQASTGNQVLAVAAKATFTRDGKPISISDLKAGQKIDARMGKMKGAEVVEQASIST